MMILLLLGPAMSAQAAEMRVEIAFPAGFAAAPVGKGAIALQVEDGRDDRRIGNSVDHEPLVPAADIATSLYALIAADLRQAGFTVVPYAASSADALHIKLVSLQYVATKEMLKSHAEVKAALVVDMAGVDTTYTFRSHVSDEYAWKPSAEKNGLLIGEALAAAVQAAFGEPDIARAMTHRQGR